MAKDREIERLSAEVRVLKLSRVCVCAYVCVWGGGSYVCARACAGPQAVKGLYVCVHVCVCVCVCVCVFVRAGPQAVTIMTHSITYIHISSHDTHTHIQSQTYKYSVCECACVTTHSYLID